MKHRHRRAGNLDVRSARQDRPPGHRVLPQHPQVAAGIGRLEGGAVLAVHLQAQERVARFGRFMAQAVAPVGAHRHAPVAPHPPMDGQPIRARCGQRIDEGVGRDIVHLPLRSEIDAGRGEHGEDVEVAGRQQLVQHLCPAGFWTDHAAHAVRRPGGDRAVVEHARCVENTVDRAEAGAAGRDHACHRFAIRHVGADGQHLRALLLQREQPAYQPHWFRMIAARGEARPAGPWRQGAPAHERQPHLVLAGQESGQVQRNVAQPTGDEIGAARPHQLPLTAGRLRGLDQLLRPTLAVAIGDQVGFVRVLGFANDEARDGLRRDIERGQIDQARADVRYFAGYHAAGPEGQRAFGVRHRFAHDGLAPGRHDGEAQRCRQIEFLDRLGRIEQAVERERLPRKLLARAARHRVHGPEMQDVVGQHRRPFQLGQKFDVVLRIGRRDPETSVLLPREILAPMNQRNAAPVLGHPGDDVAGQLGMIAEHQPLVARLRVRGGRRRARPLGNAEPVVVRGQARHRGTCRRRRGFAALLLRAGECRVRSSGAGDRKRRSAARRGEAVPDCARLPNQA